MSRIKNISSKKKQKKGSLESQEEKPERDLSKEIKRSAVAIILFTLAILTFLSFLGYAGAVGRFLNKTSALLVGWVKLILPIFLIAAGVVLLLRKTVSFYIVKLIGLVVVLLSFTGIFHWFFNSNKMLAKASMGQGGGYTGYALDYILEKYLGGAGSLVILLAMLFIGIIIAFNFSIFSLFYKFKKELKEKEEEEEKGEETKDTENQKAIETDEAIKDTSREPLSSQPKTDFDDDHKNNIKHIEFVEGNDQYISPDIENKDLTIDKILPDDQIERKSMDLKHPSHTYSKTKNSKNKKWFFPPLDLLEKSSGKAEAGDIEKNFSIIEKTLKDFGIEVERGGTRNGPTVTQYRIKPAVGVKIAKILALQDDLALALAKTIRIEAPIPGESLVGIEVPNKTPSEVRLRDLLEEVDFKRRKSNLTLALGRDVSGKCEFSNLAKMPHLMIAGATGTGKSVCINSVITALLFQNSPKNLKFIMVDPKRVELSPYNGIPHLLTDTVVENGQVIKTLGWAVGEMERRYRLFQDTASRDMASYRKKLKEGFTIERNDPETNEIYQEKLKDLPYIVIVIDELADLMSSHGKEIEGSIVRIAQMARAVGMHLIISTQRPSVEVITGLIKANITTRIAFQVATQIDSRTIIDMGGAEKLLGNGDMLYLSTNSPKPKRIQGVLVSESEVKRVVDFIKKENKQKEDEKEDITQDFQKEDAGFQRIDFDEEDELLETAKEEILRANKASASFLQRRLRIGYSRASRILDFLEEKGMIGPANGNKPREIYIANKKNEVEYSNSEEDQKKRDKWQL